VDFAAICASFQFQIFNPPDFFYTTSDNTILLSKISKKYKGKKRQNKKAWQFNHALN
jgi:hypothetical protein